VVSLRPAHRSDRPFLTQMLAVAFDWRGDASPEVLDAIMSRPDIAHYVEGWPRDGEAGVVAVEGDECLGAAWWRYFSHPDPGYGYVNDRTPEVSIGVVARHRRQGIGSLLMTGLIDEAKLRGLPGLSLSVEQGNEAAALYTRTGFATLTRIGNADTMLLELGA
jgi:GNAT superfamily N-acetyltransferase